MEEVDFVVQGVSSPGVPWTAKTRGRHPHPGVPVLAVTKGLALSSDGQLQILPDPFHDLLADALRGHAPLATIGGPCIAAEPVGRRPTDVVFAGRDQALSRQFAGALQT